MGEGDLTSFHLHILGLTWPPLGSLGFTRFHLGSLGFTWLHSVSLGLTWFHFVSLCFTWPHLVSLGSIWFHLGLFGFAPIHLVSLGFTRIHSWPIFQGKGKLPAGKREKGKHPTDIHHACTHARTRRNDFPVGLTPNLQQMFACACPTPAFQLAHLTFTF